MKKFVLTFICILCLSPLLGNISLREKLAGAKVGDFIVSEMNNSLSLIRIFEVTGDTVIVEEITFSQKEKKQGFTEWENWLKENAPGHTSWLLIEFDLKEGAILECFSFYRDAWLNLTSEDSFLLKLMNLSLSPIPKERQKKIGTAPRDGLDKRKVWTPPLYYNGTKEKKPKFAPYEVLWPSDGSPLAAKKIEFYFDDNRPSFPFPYWGKISNAADAAYKFRVIDSGEGLSSPMKTLPRRPISFVRRPKIEDNLLKIVVHAPPYYKKIELSAIDHSSSITGPIPLPFTTKNLEEELIEFIVDSKRLENGHEYSFVLHVQKPMELFLETQESVKFVGINEPAH
jgi:hypothetical protein